MLKTSICREHLFDDSMQCTDYEWPYRVALKCRTGNLPQVLIKMYRHENNISKIYHSDHAIVATKSRFKYFYKLFPRTSLPDYIAFARLADKVPMTSLRELERAGRWLVQLADYPDDKLQERMAKRWQETYERSKCLGHESEQIFSRYQKQMKSAFTRLESAC
jgi:hypothetical protein